jgi:hypothetical protein
MAEPANGDQVPREDTLSITVTFSLSRGEVNVKGCVDQQPFALGLLEAGLLLVKERWAMNRAAMRAMAAPHVVPGRFKG